MEWNDAINECIRVLADGLENLKVDDRPSSVQRTADTAAYYVLKAKIEKVRELLRP